VLNPPPDLLIAVPCTFGAELEDAPCVGAVAGGQEGDEFGQRVAVGERGVGDGRAGGYDERGRYIAEVEVGVAVAGAWAGDELAEERCLRWIGRLVDGECRTGGTDHFG
jgi:hypothetical protein